MAARRRYTKPDRPKSPLLTADRQVMRQRWDRQHFMHKKTTSFHIFALTSGLLLFGLGLPGLSGCTPTKAVRGNIVEDFRIGKIEEGVSTRSDVLRWLGSPTTRAPFDDNLWYYMGQETEKRSILDPEVVAEKIIVVAFDQTGTVTHIRKVDNDRLDIPLVTRKTRTGGHDLTLMQQLLGNVGRFNKPIEDER